MSQTWFLHLQDAHKESQDIQGTLIRLDIISKRMYDDDGDDDYNDRDKVRAHPHASTTNCNASERQRKRAQKFCRKNIISMCPFLHATGRAQTARLQSLALYDNIVSLIVYYNHNIHFNIVINIKLNMRCPLYAPLYTAAVQNEEKNYILVLIKKQRK